MPSAISAVLDGCANQFLVAGHSTVTFGPVDRFRGHVALVAGEVDAAVELLTAARDQAVTAQADLWRRWSEVDLVSALRARASAPDRRAAEALIGELRACPESARSPRLRRAVRVTDTESSS